MKASIAFVNGPNLNLLGTREPEIYGTETLADIEKRVTDAAKAKGASVRFFQSNVEGELVNYIQGCSDCAGLVINPAAYSHTSVAIRDALSSLNVPVVEVHLSNIFARESFRHHSYVSDIARGVLSGFGSAGYIMALDFLLDLSSAKDGN